MDGASSPAPKGGVEEELAYYKTQYEQLELELQDFQQSSRELETELEKDIEASEKRERLLKEKVESLGFEVEEWKTKYKQSKSESNTAQNALQKEITTLREQNRNLQFKLRDIEVANDDFERQARHQTSSLEDLESKYNMTIERGVMLEEELKHGDQEREHLRIETQRLRDELSDLKIESEIIQEKLRLAEGAIARHHDRKLPPLAMNTMRPRSPLSEGSMSATTLPSPTTSSPPHPKLIAQATPPSPPLSDASAPPRVNPITPARPRGTIDSLTTPRPAQRPRHSRGPSVSMAPRPAPTTATTRPTTKRPPRPSLSAAEPLPRSGSLYQIRGLIGKMAQLEARVHTVRSKLPAPTSTPPRASPRHGPVGTAIPSSVTVRSARKRTSGSTASSVAEYPTSSLPVSRLSLGVGARSAPTDPGSISRPSSRASVASSAGGATLSGVPLSGSMGGAASVGSQFARPPSRTSRPPSGLGQYSAIPSASAIPDHPRRPRSSISGSFKAMHGESGIAPPSSILRTSTPGPRMHGYSHSQSASVGGGEEGVGEGDVGEAEWGWDWEWDSSAGEWDSDA
ncbi:hypothetical protein EJ06DRAFT_544329 [Trichodelitschia bisporula]|uniref:NUDE domain-containing protein n=1 Tax=Trichodelitschia bisporula TaxID=703511 RepID=A0A6G1HR55_9PEZI|nr:hypothetical protein EJ06DRAFT_544329 [Trichodelitschia bisporula]